VTYLLIHGLAATLALAPSTGGPLRGHGGLAFFADQEWLDPPVLPAIFALDDPQETGEAAAQDPPRLEAPPQPPKISESPFPKLTSALDLDGWRDKDALTKLKEWAGDAFFGLPVLVPQIVLEEFLPRGVEVGPTTFLYRTSPADKSLSFVVFDQAIFHEAEFIEQVQSQGADSPYYSDHLTRSQATVLRRSLMTGFRASYALPSMSTDMILGATADQGALAYVLAPPALGALAYLKGVDQKFTCESVLKGRIVLASGRDWLRSVRSSDGVPTISVELRVFDFPIGLVGVFEMSEQGMAPLFVGLGTSLDAVTDLIAREKGREFRP
jgi:hypothetical protein